MLLLAVARTPYPNFFTSRVRVVATSSTFLPLEAERDNTRLHSFLRRASLSPKTIWVQRLDQAVLRVVGLLGPIKKNVRV